MVATPPFGADSRASALFEPKLAEEVRQLVARLDGAQRLWLSGYLAGTLATVPVAVVPEQRSERPAAIVLFGSQTGNAERLAKEIANSLRERGIPCVTMDMMDCRKAELAAAHTLLVVVSTQGEGDPPERAVPLWELLNGRKPPSLSHVRYAVLGLGDSSYEKFCETARRFDLKLQELGAHRLHPRVDCDVDFEVPARSWAQSIRNRLELEEPRLASATSTSESSVAAAVSNAYTRKNPFLAEVLLNQRLTAGGSTKEVRHIELSLAQSHIHYEPGDAIGIVPRNCAEAVQELLDALPYDPERPLPSQAGGISLREALGNRFDIGLVSPAFLQRYLQATRAQDIDAQDESRLRELARGRDLLEIVREFPPGELDTAEFVSLLRPLAPRLYSIASSARAAPDEAHLTVALAPFELRGKLRQGVVSGMLGALVSEDAKVPVYLHKNTAFRLPAADVPIIMIGPGTGVAPFRAFVAERAAIGATGRNWLFFGERCFETDFLYQSEWLAWRKQGILTRLEVAFSRDQREKIYVQHRLLQCGAEVWAWLTEGAHLYVCGDATRMAPDVHAALLEIARRHGGLSEERAAEYCEDLQRNRRYQRDVY